MNNPRADKRKRRAAATLAILIEKYPGAFFPKGSDRTRPLALGIAKKLQADAENHGLSQTKINECLHQYTHRRRYQTAIIDCVFRVNLEGRPDGKVSDAEKRHAAQRMNDLKTKAA